MPEHMMTLKALWLLIAMTASFAATAWIALSMPVHWEQVRGSASPSKFATTALRIAGVLGLLISLVICSVVDHGTMAALVWIMSLAGAAFLTAVVLSGRPRWLRPLVAWIPRTAADRRPTP